MKTDYSLPLASPIVAPSFLSADFADPQDGLRVIEQAGAPWLHLDVMDGHFVPNLTFGPKFIADLRKKTKLVFDVHLMIEKPELSVDAYLDAGAEWITFHQEACIHSHRLAQYIRSKGCKVGISLVPSTPMAAIQELLPFVDMVLIMSVNPGFGGQSLIPQTLTKLHELGLYRRKTNLPFLLSVDGGVNLNTLDEVCKAGPEILVAGSAFFSSENKANFINSLKERWNSLYPW